MEYRKIDKLSYKLHLIKTDKFKTVFFKFIFRDDIKKQDITKRNFLTEILGTSSKNYPTNRLMSIRCEELYNLRYFLLNRRIGNSILTEASFSFIDSKYLDEDITEECISFMNEILFNPNICDNKFDKKSFSIAYDYLKERIEEANNSPNYYSEMKLNDLMCKDNPASLQIIGYLDDFSKINEENLYNYYKEVVNKSIVDIFVVGDIDFYEMEKLIEKNIKIKILKNKKKDILNDFKSTRKRYQTKIEDSKFNQSKLLVGCTIKDITPFEKNYVLGLYNMILGNSPESLLFKNVREKKSLAYSISSNYIKNDNILTIKTGINKDAYEIVVKEIKKQMKNIKDGKFSIEHLENCKTLIKSLLNEFEDYQTSISEYYFGIEYLGLDSKEKKLKYVDKITKEDIIHVSKKINIDTIYFLKEQDNERN